MNKLDLTQKKIKISVNQNLIDKVQPLDKKHLSNGFDPCELLLEEFRDVISWGYCFSYQFKNQHRREENFTCTDIICVDMDGGREIEDTLEDFIVKQYGSICYTTPSHSLDHHRFRVVFVLPHTLTDVKEVKSATRSLALRLGGDPSVSDGARMFYGSSGSDPSILGNSITEEFLVELIEDGKVIPQPQNMSPSAKSTTNRSKHKLDLNQQVKLSDGNLVVLKSITTKTSIHCPFHHDTNASSFVSFNKNNEMYHYCSTCQLTRWSGVKGSDFNFNDFEESVIGLEQRSSSFSKDFSKLQRLEPPLVDQSEDSYEVENITVQDQQYLEIKEAKGGITFIKSPKGTGKTEFLKNHVRSFTQRYQTFEEYEEDTYDEDKPIYHKDRRVLLIGHRQSLIGELCNRIGLNSYLEDRNYKEQEILVRKNRYGVCLDSLWRVSKDQYDLVIIDEVEQVLSHFLSDTIGSKRFRIFEIFSRLIRESKQTIVLDSDISWVSFNILTSLIRESDEDSELKSIFIHVNLFKKKDQTIRIFPSEGQIINQIKMSILDGKRIFVSSNSKRKTKQLDKLIQEMEDQNQISVPRIIVTSENSKSTEVQTFIKNVKQEILKYRVVLSSPSLGTGIDISFDNDSQEIDCVFGIYETQVNSHLDIDQQISRVRHPKEINAFISPRIFDFETEFGVVEEDIQSKFSEELPTSNFQIQQQDEKSEISSFIKMCSRIVSYSRHSMNNLKSNFLALKEYQGYSIEWIDYDSSSSKSGTQSLTKAKSAIEEEEINDILNADPLDLYDYVRYQDRISKLQLPVSKELSLKYKRTSIELFYQEPVNRELVKEDNNGEFRASINRFKSVTDQKELQFIKQRLENEFTAKEQKIRLFSIDDFSSGCFLLYELLNSSPILEGHDFCAETEFCSTDLADFSDIASKLEKFVETQLGLRTRKDIKQKPIQHLSKLVKLVGLEIEKSRTQKIKGKKTYFYKLNATKLNLILEILDRKQDLGLPSIGKNHNYDDKEVIERYGLSWIYLNEHYNFQYTKGQMNWLCAGYNEYGKLECQRTMDNHDKWADLHGLGG